jgi:hypothetical protein
MYIVETVINPPKSEDIILCPEARKSTQEESPTDTKEVSPFAQPCQTRTTEK